MINDIEREYYVGSFQEDKKRLTQVRKTVANIVDEKKKHVSFEQVLRFVFKIKLDRSVEERRILPVSFDWVNRSIIIKFNGK